MITPSADKHGINQQGSGQDICMKAVQVSKIYPGTKALDKVDFNIYQGKVNVLIGENGAGKSTLMKILAGVEQQSEGAIIFDGKEINLENTREAAALGIGIIHQELNLFPNLNVAQNLFVAKEYTKYGVMLDQKKHYEETKKILARLEHPIPPDTMVSSLRVGQQQMIEIAKTMTQHALKVLIMDEPTSSLSKVEVEMLFRLIRDLTKQGVSIVYISHKLEEIMQIGDYVTVLRDGKLIAEESVAQIDIPWIVKCMVGHENSKRIEKQEKNLGEELLKVDSLTLQGKTGTKSLKNISFSLKKGEILGIYGLMGSGRTDLIECLMGLHPEVKGQIFLNGESIKLSSVWQQIDRGFALIPEDRQREGLVQSLNIAKNLTLSSLWKYTKLFHIFNKKEDESIYRMIQDLYIKVADKSLPILSLSGGNQQKVVIGKGILTNPKVLLLDEPTRGIDVGAKFDVFQIVNHFASQGLGIILVASELKEIISISDRVLVMSHGEIMKEFSGAEITEENLVKASELKPAEVY
jgi:erythritol transport system ATP-binding protein